MEQKEIEAAWDVIEEIVCDHSRHWGNSAPEEFDALRHEMAVQSLVVAHIRRWAHIPDSYMALFREQAEAELKGVGQ